MKQPKWPTAGENRQGDSDVCIVLPTKLESVTKQPFDGSIRLGTT